VKNVLIATAVAAVLTTFGAQAADKPATLDQVLEQLQTLNKRVDNLEQQNSTLKQENDTLKATSERAKAEGEYLKSQTRELRETTAAADSEISKLKGADWASRIVAKGDLRYRYEMIEDDISNDPDLHNARSRDRIRARLGFDAKVTDTMLVGLLVATGGDDPRSSNQTLGGGNTRKAIGFDLAYFDWKYASWGNVTGGKMKYPFVRPGQSLFYDGDVNPEGLAFGFNRGMWFGSAYSFWFEERSTAADTMLYGGQVGARLPLGSTNIMLAVQYSDLVKGQGFRPFYNCASSTAAIPSSQTIGCANGNTVVGTNQNTAVLANDFDIAELALEWNMMFGSLPFQVWGNYAQNIEADDLNVALSAGVLLGKASNYRTFEAGVGYQSIEKDALFGQLVDSDFADGKTDGEGYILRAGYAPRKNWSLNATYFINERQMDVGPKSDYNRLQADFNLKF
jgi:outer membrane murein-binding lipoprotein Lpp